MHTRKCTFCGLQHEFVKEKCPVYGKECTKCRKRNHFAKQCRTKSARVHAVEDVNSSDDSYYEELMTMELIPEMIHTVEKSFAKNIHAKMLVEGKQVLMQTDTGATCNVMPKQLIGDVQLTETNQVLSMYNKTTLRPLGRCKLKVVNIKNKKKYKVDFVVVNNGGVTTHSR